MKCNFLCSFSKEVRLSSSVIFCVLLERVLDSLLKPLIKNIVGFLLTWYFVTGVSFISDYAAILLVVIEESIFSKKKKALFYYFNMHMSEMKEIHLVLFCCYDYEVWENL